MKKFILFVVMAVTLVAAVAFGAVDAGIPVTEARATAWELVKGFLAASWPVLALWVISELQPFLPTKSSGIVHLVVLWIKGRKQ